MEISFSTQIESNREGTVKRSMDITCCKVGARYVKTLVDRGTSFSANIRNQKELIDIQDPETHMR